MLCTIVFFVAISGALCVDTTCYRKSFSMITRELSKNEVACRAGKPTQDSTCVLLSTVNGMLELISKNQSVSHAEIDGPLQDIIMGCLEKRTICKTKQRIAINTCIITLSKSKFGKVWNWLKTNYYKINIALGMEGIEKRTAQELIEETGYSAAMRKL